VNRELVIIGGGGEHGTFVGVVLVDQRTARPNCHQVGLHELCDFAGVHVPRHFRPQIVVRWVEIGELILGVPEFQQFRRGLLDSGLTVCLRNLGQPPSSARFAVVLVELIDLRLVHFRKQVDVFLSSRGIDRHQRLMSFSRSAPDGM
jgi:hypothetical protein